MSYNIKNPNDNADTWMAQYPELLPKNFTGISVIWDENNPPVTRQVLPSKNMPFNFVQRIKIDPLLMAPQVQEGANTPMASREYIVQKYVCTPYRIGELITEQQISHGLKDVVKDVTESLVDSVNLSITYDNIQTLQGVGVTDSRVLERLNLSVAGEPHGIGTAKEWSDPASEIIEDILAMKTLIKKKSGSKAVALYVPTDEYEYIQKNDAVIEQLKYTTPDFLAKGDVLMIKGIMVYEVDTFYKDHKKRDEKIQILRNKAIMVGTDVGYTAVATPKAGSAPIIKRWEDYDKVSVVVQARASTVSVVKDYGKVGIISGTSS